MTTFSRIRGIATGLIPTRNNEGNEVDVRTTLRGEAVVSPLGKARCSLAEEGSYFVAVNATPGTGLAGIAAADGYDATESLCTIRNTGNTNNIVLDYIKVQTTVAGTNGTNLRWDAHIDGIDRWTSGGTAIVEKNTNMSSTAGSNADIHFGAIVSPAAGSDVRRVGGGLLRTVISVVGDQFVFDFGGEPAQGSGAPQNGTLAAVLKTMHAPVVLGPGDSYILTLNAASQTVGQSYEFEIGFWER